MENVKFSVAILLANDLIGKSIIKRIDIGSEITVLGTDFSHSEVFKNGSEQSFPMCLQKMDVIVATELSIY